MEKLSYLANRIEEHFGGLKSDISILKHELKEEIEGIKSTLTGAEKSLESAWNVIADLQADSKSTGKKIENPLMFFLNGKWYLIHC